MLRDINLRKSYRSDEHNLIKDFYIPCFSVSVFYKRAVGYFSSSALSLAARGIYSFIKGGGKMELIASPYLSKDDIENINKGYILRREVEKNALIRTLEDECDIVTNERLGILAWLIEQKRLNIKIAVLKDRGKQGIYHEKLGIFYDGSDYVAFTGSPNESESGLVSNFENIDVFCSWRPEDEERVEEKIKNFIKLWEDNTHFLRVYRFPEAARLSLLRKRVNTIPDKDSEEDFIPVNTTPPKGCPKLPKDLYLRPYQRKAIENWYDAKCQGTFMMATGSGKTITALSIIERLYAEYGLRAVIIIAPYRHLVVQWAKECEKFDLNPICCFETQKKWFDILSASLYSLQSGNLKFLSVITTNSTYSMPNFQSLLKYFPLNSLIIGDESHNLGSSRIISLLPEHIRMRLALSATPERWFDNEGTQDLYNYFGPIVFEFTLKEAIEQSALVPYRYFPLFVHLTDEESERFLELSRKIASAFSSTKKIEESSQVTILLGERARLIGTAYNKLIALHNLMKERIDTSHTLFYCGDGSVEETLTFEMKKQIDQVCHILGYQLGYRVDKYVAETSLDERDELRVKFDIGDLQGLVAIRCLDEGIDIPSIRTAVILASSTNPRQFIQRRGRILRKFHDKKEAEIFDMIVLPPGECVSKFQSERTLLKQEINRCLEFANLALNSGEIRSKLIDIQLLYGLL